jgi:hypothetical protein
LVAVAVGVILAGATFALANFGSGGGSSSPEAAVDDLLHAVSGEDVIGTLETLRPAERDALRGPLEDAVGELERLELLADVDLDSLQGVDVEIEGYQLLTTELTPDIVAVTVSGGTVSGASTPTELPIGDTMRAILEEDLEVELPEGTEQDSGDLGEFQLVATREGGGWYVSPGYSVAEWARQQSGEALPPFDGRVAPVGGESPEAALRQLVTAAADLDAEGVITQLDPAEMAAVYDYAPLFLDDADQAAAEAREDTTFEIDLSELRTEDGPDGTRRVFLEGFSGRMVERSADFGTRTQTFSYDGTCIRWEETWELEEHALDLGDALGGEFDFGDQLAEPESGEWCEGEEFVVEDEYGESVELPAWDAGLSEVSVITVERDGRWFVAPGRSVLELIPAALRGVDESDIEAMRKWIRELIGPFEYEGEFEDVGDVIEGDDSGDYFDTIPEDEYEPEPIDQCYASYEGGPFNDDPVHTGLPVVRLSYLQQQDFEACVDDLIAAGELSEAEADVYRSEEPCWKPYELLADDASRADWEAADAEVEACFDDAYGFDPEEPEVEDPDGDGFPGTTPPPTATTGPPSTAPPVSELLSGNSPDAT